jgi:hypothetical protein
MILNSRNSNFILTFPKNFLYPKIQERYKTYLKRLPLPYDSVTDYLNASVQSTSFPGANIDVVEQRLYEDRVNWKDGLSAKVAFKREFSVEFKSYEGYINYWMMFDLLQEYANYDNKEQFLPDVTLSFLDQTGFELIVYEYQQIIMTGISDLQLNFTSNAADFQSFTCDFMYNYFKVKRRLD